MTKATGAYSIAGREQALDFVAENPGYGEQRWYSNALGTSRSRSAGGGCRPGPAAARPPPPGPGRRSTS
jgi:hypothetical protein